MLRLLLLAFIIGAIWRAWRAGADLDPLRITRTLWRLGITAALARILLASITLPIPAMFREPLILLAGLAGAVALAELVWLVEKKSRPVDHWVRTFALIGILASTMGRSPSTGPVTGLLLFGTLAWRWRDALRTRALSASALGAIGLIVVAALTANMPEPHGLSGLGEASWMLSRVAWSVALAYAVMGLFPVVGAFLRDPSLGIHTVRRRLALSHLLVLLVPLLITIALWILTTWLGVGAERAMTGKRVIEHQAQALRGELAAQLASPTATADAPAMLARLHHAEWPHLRLWRVADGAASLLVRAMGDSIPREALLARWLANADSLPRQGIVQLGGHRYLGALATTPATGSLLALVPVSDLLPGAPSRLSGAKMIMTEVVAAADTSEPRNANRPRVRIAPSQKKPSVVVYGAGRDTIEANDATFSENGIQGMALIAGIQDRNGAFHRTDFSLRAQVRFGDTLLGLYQNLRENPLSVVPIAILTLLVGLLLPVAIFNFRLVGGLGRSFTVPVAALRDATESLGAGHLDHRVAVQGDDELWQTAAAFNTMAEGLERARTREQERVRFENELELARRIQERLLPAAPPDVAGLEIAGATEPAREVGGDYFDHLVLPDGRVLLVIADVSGKGVPAALLMSAFRAGVMSQEDALTEPERLAERLNAFLYRSVESGRFVTAFFALLDPATGAMQYVNAGHNPALLLRADGHAEWLMEGGLILGIMPASTFTRGETRLASGDLFVLYTDGVTEGANATAEQFGEVRLLEAARRLTGLRCAAAAQELVREVRAFEGATGPADDITVLIARTRPRS